MTYLVMECKKAYAVVLSEDKRFIKVANLNYQVGQKIDRVIELEVDETRDNILQFPKIKSYFATAAACLALLFVGTWQMYFVEIGTLEMQINPSLKFHVNRMNYVLSVEGTNDDGEKLLENYKPHISSLENATKELTDIAKTEGYFEKDATIYIKAQSKNEKWAEKTQTQVYEELSEHLGEKVTVGVGEKPIKEETVKKEDDVKKENTVVIPSEPDRDDDNDDDDGSNVQSNQNSSKGNTVPRQNNSGNVKNDDDDDGNNNTSNNTDDDDDKQDINTDDDNSNAVNHNTNSNSDDDDDNSSSSDDDSGGSSQDNDNDD